MGTGALGSTDLSAPAEINSNKLSYLLCQTEQELDEDKVHITFGQVGLDLTNEFGRLNGSGTNSLDRRVYNDTDVTGVFKLNVNGGAQGDLRTRDTYDTFTVGFPGRARAASINFDDGEKVYMGLQGYHRTSTSQRYILCSSLALSGLDDFYAPYFVIIEGGAWVMRLSPKNGSDEIVQTGVYSIPSGQIAFDYGITPRMGFSSGTPSMVGVKAELHWREDPNGSAYYALNGGAVITYHSMTIRVRECYAMQLLAPGPEAGGYTAGTFDNNATPTWPPA